MKKITIYVNTKEESDFIISLFNELEKLRAYKKREDMDMKKLIGSPSYKKYVDGLNIQGVGITI